MQAGKNISSSKISQDKSASHPYRCVGGNGLRGYVSEYNTSGHHAIVGRQGALCGCLNIEEGDFYATEHAVVVDSYEIISPIFLFYFLTALNLNQYATATAQPGLAVSNIIEVLFPLPPVAEQIKIVDKVVSLSPLVETYDCLERQIKGLNNNLRDKLKASILQDAIRGRLVPQIESEGTAEELLKEIRAEKMRLVKEGKRNKSAIVNESRIFRGDDSKYYEQVGETVQEIETEYHYPKSWELLRIQEICVLTDGEKREGTFICLDAKYLRGKSTGEFLSKGKFVQKRDNIILVDGENSGEVFAVPTDGYMGSTFKQLWISHALNKEYILLFILFHKNNLRNSKKGAAIPHLNKDIFNNLIIGIPPLAEQNRIVKQVNGLTKLLK